MGERGKKGKTSGNINIIFFFKIFECAAANLDKNEKRKDIRAGKAERTQQGRQQQQAKERGERYRVCLNEKIYEKEGKAKAKIP